MKNIVLMLAASLALSTAFAAAPHYRTVDERGHTMFSVNISTPQGGSKTEDVYLKGLTRTDLGLAAGQTDLSRKLTVVSVKAPAGLKVAMTSARALSETDLEPTVKLGIQVSSDSRISSGAYPIELVLSTEQGEQIVINTSAVVFPDGR
ncbi:hypothetical protein HNR42_000007 [Deinobacterium chartae]|uniref:Uncharacterized protein n=1 Tax=Deinobacterium chartae TaxID=521158 RepID=A0A841HXS1_9DEIO|nr:hypothetical protein [Deinobacterium chartae]MBB6096595.1 hypothetical protein [Deinobacterium chartae]